MKTRRLNLLKHTHRYFGGSTPKTAAIPPPIPPVSETNSDVGYAQQDQRTQSLRRKGLQSTILAGETGGTAGNSGFPQMQTKTLLGG